MRFCALDYHRLPYVSLVIDSPVKMELVLRRKLQCNFDPIVERLFKVLYFPLSVLTGWIYVGG